MTLVKRFDQLAELRNGIRHSRDGGRDHPQGRRGSVALVPAGSRKMIADLKPYPAYKDSGLPWLGQVAAHWDISRSKRLFSPRKDFPLPEDVQLSATQAYGVIPQSEFEERVGRRVVKISMHLEKGRHVERNDFNQHEKFSGRDRACMGVWRHSFLIRCSETRIQCQHRVFCLPIQIPRLHSGLAGNS